MALKAQAIIYLLILGASSQDVSSLPQCGQTCVNNMLAIAQSQFGCSSGDVECYCTKANFGYGLRDCANEACTAQDAETVIAFGVQYCSSALTSGSQSGSVSATAGSASGTAQATSFVSSTATQTFSSPIGSIATSASGGRSTTSPATSSPTSTTGFSSSSPSKGLTTNAKIGIAAGIPCGVLVITGFVGAYFLGKRRARGPSTVPALAMEHPPPPGYGAHEIDGQDVRRHELETRANRTELPEKT